MSQQPSVRKSWPNIVGQPTQHGQQCKDTTLLWWPGTEPICGRNQATQHQWFVRFAWGTDAPTDDTISLPDDGGVTYPRIDLRNQFNWVYMTREKCLRPLAVDFSFGLGYYPSFRYVSCHWYSGLYSNVTLGQLNWALYYGDSAMCFASDSSIPPNQDDAVTVPYDGYDSQGHSTSTSIDDPPTASGWILTLLSTKILPTNPDDPASPLTVVTRPLILYTLDKDDDPPPEGPTVFKGQDLNIFRLIHNPVNFPPHHAHLFPSHK